MGKGLITIMLNQFLPPGNVHLHQHGEAWIIHTYHNQAFNPSLHMGTPPTKSAIMKRMAQEGLAMGEKMTLILPIVSRLIQIPGSWNKHMLHQA